MLANSSSPMSLCRAVREQARSYSSNNYDVLHRNPGSGSGYLDFQRNVRTLRTAPFNEGIFRLSEKPDGGASLLGYFFGVWKK